MGLKALGQFYLRHHNAIQTVGLLALLTVEVGVHIIIVIVVMTMAELKTLTIHSAINHMHQMVLTEKLQRTENARFINCIDSVLQLGHGLWQHRGFECLYHRNTVGRGLDAMLKKQLFVILSIHKPYLYDKNIDFIVHSNRHDPDCDSR